MTAILVKATEGRIGRMRTLRIAVQAAEGRWLLCERKLVEKLETPLPELGEEHPLDEPRASQRFLLRATERPRLCSDVALLSAPERPSSRGDRRPGAAPRWTSSPRTSSWVASVEARPCSPGC